MGHYNDAFLVPPAMQDVLGDVRLVSALLQVQGVLARARARAGQLPSELALSMASTCKVELFDVAKIAREGARAGDLLPALHRDLHEAVALFNPEAAAQLPTLPVPGWLDTGLAMVVRDAMALLLADLATSTEHAPPDAAEVLRGCHLRLTTLARNACALPVGLWADQPAAERAWVASALGLPLHEGPALAQGADAQRLAAELSLTVAVLRHSSVSTGAGDTATRWAAHRSAPLWAGLLGAWSEAQEGQVPLFDPAWWWPLLGAAHAAAWVWAAVQPGMPKRPNIAA